MIEICWGDERTSDARQYSGIQAVYSINPRLSDRTSTHAYVFLRAFPIIPAATRLPSAQTATQKPAKMWRAESRRTFSPN